MRTIRRIIGDATSGGVLAALVAFMLLLQGAIGAYARAEMVSSQADSAAFVICAAHGVESQPDQKNPLQDAQPDCCSAACQIACNLGAALPPEGVFLKADRPTAPHAGLETVVRALTPHALGLAGEARAPPLSPSDV